MKTTGSLASKGITMQLSRVGGHLPVGIKYDGGSPKWLVLSGEAETRRKVDHYGEVA